MKTHKKKTGVSTYETRTMQWLPIEMQRVCDVVGPLPWKSGNKIEEKKKRSSRIQFLLKNGEL